MERERDSLTFFIPKVCHRSGRVRVRVRVRGYKVQSTVSAAMVVITSLPEAFRPRPHTLSLSPTHLVDRWLLWGIVLLCLLRRHGWCSRGGGFLGVP